MLTVLILLVATCALVYLDTLEMESRALVKEILLLQLVYTHYTRSIWQSERQLLITLNTNTI